MSIVVYKLGGSLLDLQNLRERLDSLWSTRPPHEKRLVVVGGGKAADLVREWDALFALGDNASHNLALASMQLTRLLMSCLIPDGRVVKTAKDAAALEPGSTGIASAESLLAEAERGGLEVPECWDLTADSIAAICAQQVGAVELILLKSADPPETATVLDLMRNGGLDPIFNRWIAEISRIGWVNLRNSPQIHWLAGFADAVAD